MKTYDIKAGYQCNPIDYYAGSVHNSACYQIPVYKFAAEIIQKYNLKNCMDIGCGFGIKIVDFLCRVCNDVTGIDLESAIARCREEYDFGSWFVDNIEVPHLVLNRKFDLIMAADVIEHLQNPDSLFDYIKKYSKSETFIILSTPERDIVRGKNSLGPPLNPCHVREWNQTEFLSYVTSCGLSVQEIFLDKALVSSKQKDCQILLAKW